MADNVYKIIFENKTEEEKEKAQTSAPTSNGTQPSDNSGASATLTKSKYLKAMAPVGFALSVADRYYASHVSTISIRTGNEEKQQQQQFYYGIAKRGLNLAKSVALGAVFGGLPGALAGAGLGAVQELVSISIRQNEIDISRQNENTAIFLNQIRMGAGSRREGRTR